MELRKIRSFSCPWELVFAQPLGGRRALTGSRLSCVFSLVALRVSSPIDATSESCCLPKKLTSMGTVGETSYWVGKACFSKVRDSVCVRSIGCSKTVDESFYFEYFFWLLSALFVERHKKAQMKSKYSVHGVSLPCPQLSLPVVFHSMLLVSPGLMILSIIRLKSLCVKVMAVWMTYGRTVSQEAGHGGSALLLPSSAVCCGSNESSRAAVNFCKLSDTCLQNEKLICLCAD